MISYKYASRATEESEDDTNEAIDSMRKCVNELQEFASHREKLSQTATEHSLSVAYAAEAAGLRWACKRLEHHIFDLEAPF